MKEREEFPHRTPDNTSDDYTSHTRHSSLAEILFLQCTLLLFAKSELSSFRQSPSHERLERVQLWFHLQDR